MDKNFKNNLGCNDLNNSLLIGVRRNIKTTKLFGAEIVGVCLISIVAYSA